MQILAAKIENYRSIEFLEISFDNLTAIVGGNNSGKSTILKAIDLFFSSSPRISMNDYFQHDSSRKIAITIEFGQLTPSERGEFEHAISDGRLRVVREFGGSESHDGEYSFFAKVNPEFAPLRNEKNGNTRRSLYAKVRERYGLPAATGEEVDEVLKNWEKNNSDKLELGISRTLFGAKNVALGKLLKKTAVRFVPAVKDASEETNDSRKSPVINLLSEIVKQTFENKEEYRSFILDSNRRLAEITDPGQVPQLAGISERLTSVLGKYYSDTGLVADLSKADMIDISFPTPSINVIHRGLQVDVAQVGHGLQRAILFSIVQFLAEQQSTIAEGELVFSFEEPQSDIILLIEEPEIYQHPLKQNLFYKSFSEIAEGYNKSTGIRIQIVYATHSEKFVNIVEIDKVRLISKKNVDGEFYTFCNHLTIGEFSNGMALHLGEDVKAMSETSFKAGLHIFSREISEGFFAEKIILVEGVSDREIIKAAYSRRMIDPFQQGIAIIQCDGKTKIDKPLFAFKNLGISCFPVFDNDSDEKGDARIKALKCNRRIQALVESKVIEDFPSGCSTAFAAFDGNLEKYLGTIIGESYGAIKQDICKLYNIRGAEACKSPAAASGILVKAIEIGYSFKLLDEIIDRVSAI